MRTLKLYGSLIFSSAILFCSLLLISVAPANADEATIAEGKKLAFNRKKGNCLACHMIAGGTLPGDIGPPLIAMKARFPDRAKLRAQIWDATATNPGTIMPPFGKNEIVTDAEIDKITDFILSL
jgi:L-cysteine S-thiosulfotransferase